VGRLLKGPRAVSHSSKIVKGLCLSSSFRHDPEVIEEWTGLRDSVHLKDFHPDLLHLTGWVVLLAVSGWVGYFGWVKAGGYRGSLPVSCKF